MKRLRPDERKSVISWDEYRRELINATVVDSTETHAMRLNRIAKLEDNPEAWFSYYFPHYYKSSPAKFHIAATRRLFRNPRWYEVRAWSRELAKSVRAMMEVTYLALTGQVKNVLLVSNSQDNATRLLMPFMINLESNNRILNDYGLQKNVGNWEIGEFTTVSGVAFRALGAGQSPRGSRNEASRPDFILIDDIDTDEETRNPDRIQKKWEWIEQALIPTVSVSGNYRILVNGNIIAKDCCISRAIEKADHTDVVNIRGKNGKSSWPEKNSEADIDKILSLISTASAEKEFFNNPVSVGEVFNEMHWGKVPPLRSFPFLVSYGDPAPSNKTKSKGGSYKSILLVGYKDGIYYVVTGYLDRVVNADFVNWYYFNRDYVGERSQVYNYIENNTLQDPFYEQVFMPLFTAKAKEMGSIIGIIPDTRNKPYKFSRIEGNLEPLNRMGKLVLNEAERENPHMKRLEEQFLLLTPTLSAPADGPDCVEGAVYIINQKLTALSPGSYRIGKVQKDNHRIGKVQKNNQRF